MTSVPLAAAPPAGAVTKRRNVLGIVAFAIVVLAYLTPVGFFVFGFSVASGDSTNLLSDPSWLWISALFWAAIGLIFAGIPAAIGLILGIASLFVRLAGRVFGILAICFAAPPVLVAVVAWTFPLASSGPAGVPL